MTRSDMVALMEMHEQIRTVHKMACRVRIIDPCHTTEDLVADVGRLYLMSSSLLKRLVGVES